MKKKTIITISLLFVIILLIVINILYLSSVKNQILTEINSLKTERGKETENTKEQTDEIEETREQVNGEVQTSQEKNKKEVSKPQKEGTQETDGDKITEDAKKYEFSSEEKILYNFITEKMFVEGQGIRTNYFADTDCEYGLQGKDVLSESIGLIMEYALLTHNKELFDQNYNILKRNFLSQGGSVYWVYKGKPNSTLASAPIDDLRISYCLFKGFAKWGDANYKSTATLIANNILKNEVKQDLLVNNYNLQPRQQSNIIKLSYLNIKYMNYINKFVPGFDVIADKSTELMVRGKYQVVPLFINEYNLESGLFIEEKEVNMIDTLLTAINLVEAGYAQDKLLDWLEEEFKKNAGKIYGRYNPLSGKPSVDFESTAVYSLVSNLSLLDGRYDFSDLVIQRMLEFQDDNAQSPSYGGFVSWEEKYGHSFDNLQALIALRLNTISK